MPITDYYVTTDAMGSVMAVLDEAGNVLERRSYDAFGEVTYMLADGTVVPDSPTGVDIGFQGQLMDELTGMYQMGYRWYSPVLGRWVSRDPIGLEGGVNPMTFTKNQPINLGDRLGLTSEITYQKTCDGPILSVTFKTVAEFIKIVETLPDASITKISFGGHSEPGAQGIGDDDRLDEKVALDYAGNPIVYGASNGNKIQKLADILRGKMKVTSTVACTGCSVGKEENVKYVPDGPKSVMEYTSIPKEISRTIRGVTAIGSTAPTLGFQSTSENFMFPFTVNRYFNGKKL